MQLSVFELITASYAADGYNLRDDWFGSKTRKVESRKERLEQEALLQSIEATEFLQAISLLHSHELRQADVAAGKTGKQVRPVSAKRADVLQLPLAAWQQWADDLEVGFRNVGRFLRKECFYSRRELPYSTQLVPLGRAHAARRSLARAPHLRQADPLVLVRRARRALRRRRRDPHGQRLRRAHALVRGRRRPAAHGS